MEIQRERVSSSQNEHQLGGGGWGVAQKQTRTNKGGEGVKTW